MATIKDIKLSPEAIENIKNLQRDNNDCLKEDILDLTEILNAVHFSGDTIFKENHTSFLISIINFYKSLKSE